MAENRTPRELDEREIPETFTPVDGLPAPTEREGWVHRWVRVSTFNEADPGNLTTRRLEGWEPCVPSEYPELSPVTSLQSGDKDHIIFRGLMLCRTPKSKALARKQYYEQKARAQVQGVDNNFLREQDQDKKMPLFVERESKFGPGTR